MTDYQDPPVGTLCWCCARCYGGCSWSRKTILGYNPKPVEGWEAIRRDVMVQDTHGMHPRESYAVLDCPNFALDSKFKGEYARFSKKYVKVRCNASAKTGIGVSAAWKKGRKT